MQTGAPVADLLLELSFLLLLCDGVERLLVVVVVVQLLAAVLEHCTGQFVKLVLHVSAARRRR